jgi:hypothetical protein
MRNVKVLAVYIFSLAGFLCWGSVYVLEAGQALSVGGGQARVDLQFRINIPQILFLQVGQPGIAIETIGFNLAELPGSVIVAGEPGGIPVRASGLVPKGQTITLTADSATPLSNGANVIPFSAIAWQSSGDFPGGGFNDRPNQKIGQWTGSGDRQGTYSFNYQNVGYYPPGNYVGQVTYTLSTP